VQAAKTVPSRRHWKLAPPSLAEKEKLALALALGLGGLAVIVVVGAVVSTVQS
jgi:hypothetical protein